MMLSALDVIPEGRRSSLALLPFPRGLRESLPLWEVLEGVLVAPQPVARRVSKNFQTGSTLR